MVAQTSPPRATPNTVKSESKWTSGRYRLGEHTQICSPGPLNPANSVSKLASGHCMTNQCPPGAYFVDVLHANI
eukprot:5658718-Heterocapsa_arctica.AAC.1